MPLHLLIIVFVTVVAVVFAFGAAACDADRSVLGARLRALGGQASQPVEDKPAMKERIEQALDPLSKAIPLSRAKFPAPVRWLIQAGYRDPVTSPSSRQPPGLCLFGFGLVVLRSGFGSPMLLVSVTALGFFLPRFVLKRLISDRQQRIKLGLPDALDLTVICVEAGLALDQALMRVGQDLQHAHPN